MISRLGRLLRFRPTRPSELDHLPLVGAASPRARLRRGGPRTPLPLVGLIAICAGVGVAYVGQIAHSTQATYQASDLQNEQAQLRAQAATLDDQLARLRATERIVDAAQHLGMRPAAHWAYVSAKHVNVISAPKPAAGAAAAASDPVQRFIAALGSVLGLKAP